MALLGKERVVSFIPSTTTIRISVTVADLIANIFKVFILKVAKPEAFYKL
jgi:hypothetical protein